MVKQGILITPVLGEVLTNLAPLRMKHSASVPAYHKGKPTWLSLYLSHVPHTSSVSLTLCKGISLIGEWQDALFDSIKTFFTDNMLHLTSIFSGNFGIHTKTD